ncbi:hypothetical protein [Micromonospora okii]|uniref:hypothetical protein n=1 Tax=Micromonospora okii TaxID=1182970 RepID=UPI001E2EA729|nr:hypothetical protein [Micromonospora okii]
MTVLARTLPDARAARRALIATHPEVRGAFLASTHGACWRNLGGQRTARAFVVPGAETGPGYLRCLDVLRRNLRKTPGADADVCFLPVPVPPAERAVRAVLALHKPITGTYVNAPDVAVCEHCTAGGDPYCYVADTYPCPTVAAVLAEGVEVML